jgi:hypothetical protein
VYWSAALAAEGTPLNRTGIAEVIAEQGLLRMWRRPDAERGGPAREVQARAEALDFTSLPERAETRLAGLLLAIPDLIALGVPQMVAAAGYPSTGKIPALSYVLSLLALKLTSTRRVSHVYDIAADPGAGLLAGLTALPKATALTTYSYRNVDLDVVLSVLAHTVCAALRRRLPGYHAATPDTLQRRFLNTGGIIENEPGQTTIRLARRTYSPVLRQASLPDTITVPWWEGRTLRYQYD